jgi:toxin YoeB
MRCTGTRDFDGYWSHRITADHRLVYALLDREIRISASRYQYRR